MRSYREGGPDPEDWPPEARQLLDEAVGSLDDHADDVERDEALRPGPPGEARMPASQAPPDLRKHREWST